MRVRVIFVLLFVLLSLIACERKLRDYAGKKSPELQEGDVTAKSVLAANRSTVPQDVPVYGVTTKGAGPDGAEVYGRTCAACHQINGAGIPGAFPPLDRSPYVVGDNLERLGAIIVYGLSGPINVNGVPYSSAMAALGTTLSDEEIVAVANYVRGSWNNIAAPSMNLEIIAKVRAQHGVRGPFNIAELGEEK